MKKRGNPEQQFGYRIAKILRKHGFTVVTIPMSQFRIQLIDMFASKNQRVWPIELKSRTSKRAKQHNREQLEMQMKEFRGSGNFFFKLEQSDTPGAMELVCFNATGNSDLLELKNILGRKCRIRGYHDYELLVSKV